MPADLDETSLIALLAAGFGLALLFGMVVNLPRRAPYTAPDAVRG
jgi:hypothetical protein